MLVNNPNNALQVIADTLNEAQMLLRFDIEILPHKIKLCLDTDIEELEYTSITIDGMIKFLERLKELTPFHKEDIDELLEEIDARARV